MVDSRESRAHAAEIKFLVDSETGHRIREWARVHLEGDPHGSGPFADEYETTSLYFDTQAQDVFHRRGSFARAKYRIRRYAEADSVFLERKLRRPGMVVKRRTLVPIEVLESLNRATVEGPSQGRWFRRRVDARSLQPTCQVSYHRMARGTVVDGAPARLTLDSSLRAVPIQEARFGPSPGVPVLDPHLILELKYRAPLPQVFAVLIDEFGLRQQAVSKYRSAMAALGHHSDSREAEAIPEGTASA